MWRAKAAECDMARSRLHIVGFVFLAFCTSSLAQNRAEEEFYRVYPDLRAQKDIVQLAYDRTKQDGFKAKNLADLLLNRNPNIGTKIPYWQVLELYNEAQSLRAFKETYLSLPDYAHLMNNGTGSRAFDEGLNDNWLRHVGASIDTSFVNSWGFLILVAVLGLIFLLIVFRVTARTPTTGQQDQPRPPGESVWQRAMRPAGVAAKWGSVCGMLSVFMSHQHISLIQWVGLVLLFSVAVGLVISVPVYLIALLCYATRVGSQTVATRE